MYHFLFSADLQCLDLIIYDCKNKEHFINVKLGYYSNTFLNFVYGTQVHKMNIGCTKPAVVLNCTTARCPRPAQLESGTRQYPPRRWTRFILLIFKLASKFFLKPQISWKFKNKTPSPQNHVQNPSSWGKTPALAALVGHMPPESNSSAARGWRAIAQ